jgi:hypothetical protein
LVGSQIKRKNILELPVMSSAKEERCLKPNTGVPFFCANKIHINPTKIKLWNNGNGKYMREEKLEKAPDQIEL